MIGYDFPREKVPLLIELGVIPEQPKPESGVIIDFLKAHGDEYDRFSFSVRLGEGQTADPSFLPGVQRSQEWSSKKRLDVLAWQGDQPTIVEAKIRVSPDLLGKLLMYRQLFLEELPDAPEPRLVGLGRFVDDDVQRVLSAHGIDVFLYAAETPE